MVSINGITWGYEEMKEIKLDQYDYRTKVRERANKFLIDIDMCLRAYGYSPMREESTWTIALGLASIEFQFPITARNMVFLKEKEVDICNVNSEYTILHGKGDHAVFLLLKSDKGQFNGSRAKLQHYRIHPKFFLFLVEMDKLEKIFSKKRASELREAYLKIKDIDKEVNKNNFKKLRREHNRLLKRMEIYYNRYSNITDKYSIEYSRNKTIMRKYFKDLKRVRNSIFDLIRRAENIIEFGGDWLKDEVK